ncbi:MAG: flavodoxin domain-containing protein [Candidatus Heimdallarchaeota archaeon]|nr:flavodoxin domain-containing protein [Candidatus Heimdallarchaeota archaeon]
MEVLVTYYSQTGNTKIIAEAIHEIASQNNDSTLKDFKDLKVEELDNYDLVFLGSACHHADLAPPVLRFVEKIPESPKFKLAGFVTHSTYTPEGSERHAEFFEQWASKCSKTYEKLQTEKSVDYKGYFRCMGVPSKPIEGFIHAQIITDEDEWAEYLNVIVKHPNEIDVENAKKFAKEILDKC